MRRFTALLIVGASLVLLSACRVDVKLDVTADQDGAGRLTITTDIDNEAATLVPGLAEDLRLDDLLQSGWKVEGPTQVNNGGLRVVLTYDFDSPAEANAVLLQINGPNGPLLNPSLKRTVDGRNVATTFDATLQFVGGIEAFSDRTQFPHRWRPMEVDGGEVGCRPHAVGLFHPRSATPR